MPEQNKSDVLREQAVPTPIKTVKFIHRDGGHVPTFAADGAWGILNHSNIIRLCFYTENPITPSAVIQPVNQDGTPKGDQIQEGVDDPDYYKLVRDFQCNVNLTLPNAVQVYQTLGNFIRLAQHQMKEQTEVMRSQMKEAQEKKGSGEVLK